MRRFLTLAGASSGRRRWVVLMLGLAAAASTMLVASSGSWVGAESQQAVETKAAAGADLNAARALAVANVRAHGAGRAVATRKPEDAVGATRQAARGAHGSPPQDVPLAHDRTADNSHAGALFAAHSWYVAPPPPPPAPPPPPVAPTAPPFPYTFVGAYTSQGDGTVYFLAQGDRVIDAHVGDRLDGVYQFESATAGQLTFNYLPLNIRQLLSTGAPQ